MDTLSHGFWTYFVLRRYPGTAAAIWGSLAPDVGLLIQGVKGIVNGTISPFRPWVPQLFQDGSTFFIDTFYHSLFLWLLLLLMGWAVKSSWLQFFAYGGLGHIGIDMLTHQVYGDAYFWPFSWYVPTSPIDYRSPVFILCNTLLAMIALFWMYYERRILNKRRFQKIALDE